VKISIFCVICAKKPQSALMICYCIAKKNAYLCRKDSVMTRANVTSAIKMALRGLPYTMDVRLFGSEARGDARENSDIDLLILLDSEQVNLSDEEKVFSKLYPIELQYGIAINPIILPKNDWGKRKTPLYENIEKEGVAL